MRPSGGRAIVGEDGWIFSLQEHLGRQCDRCSVVLLRIPDGALRIPLSHSIVESRQAATGKGEGEPAMSRNQTSLSTVAAVKIARKVMSDEYVVTRPVSDQQQTSRIRKGVCALGLLIPTPRLYKLNIRLKTTKQRVQMHSTATDVGTLADGKICLVTTL